MAAVDAAVGVRRDPEAQDGIVYVMLRDGPSQRLHFVFDPAQLLIHPIGAPSHQKAPTDDVLRLVAEAGEPVSRQYVATKLSTSLNTARDRLEALVVDGILRPSEGPRKQLLYSLLSSPVSDTTDLSTRPVTPKGWTGVAQVVPSPPIKTCQTPF
jgi:hypothetical protein